MSMTSNEAIGIETNRSVTAFLRGGRFWAARAGRRVARGLIGGSVRLCCMLLVLAAAAVARAERGDDGAS